MNINKEILKTIKYFSFFAYYPTLDEIHTFLQAGISRNSLNKELVKMVEAKKLLASKDTPPQYSISKIKDQKSKTKISQKKLKNWRFRAYVRLLSIFPQIKLVGLSGSISMMNAKEADDIDLFIITARNRLFTGRLVSLFLAQLLGLRRNRNALSSKNKVCLNLIFDESNLKVPYIKQTEFVGHEVLQMKPIMVRGDIYERFLGANGWVFKLFPNANISVSRLGRDQIKSTGSPTRSRITSQFLIFNFLEVILKKLQLNLINKHKTSEIITPTQLWFHPDDFEKKIKKAKLSA